MWSASFAHSCPNFVGSRTAIPRRSSTACSPGSSPVGSAVDEEEVEAVADAEAIQACLDELLGLGRIGGRVDVEDATTLRVSKRANAVARRLVRQRRGGLTAAAEDHERE